jgi:hypothetical protein
MMEPDFKHCDDYIDDESQPEALRKFLDYARSPAHGMERDGAKPKLFADYNGVRHKVNMASRFGDVGITLKLHADYGYDLRVAVSELSNFSDTSQ